jgi:hypothetical protein
MSALRVFAARSLCGLLLCVPAVSQQSPPAPPQQPAQPPANQTDPNRAQFRTSVTDVIVPVTVTDD